ncbi:MAG: hypothetical protein LBB72_04640 [Spirochaetaceae bacterium]|jgi:hypothetical protein|nr:hypothetical protein [Spirochaetaceae bacterium]
MFTNAKDPRWTDKTHSKIIIDVLLTNETEYSFFVASPNDCTTHGPMLYNFALNGIFGEVAASDEERIIAGELPVPEGYMVQDGTLVNIAAYEQEATAELNRRLAELNSEEAKARAEIDAEYAAERKAKLAALLAVKQQPGWPVTVEWPEGE